MSNHSEIFSRDLLTPAEKPMRTAKTQPNRAAGRMRKSPRTLEALGLSCEGRGQNGQNEWFIPKKICWASFPAASTSNGAELPGPGITA